MRFVTALVSALLGAEAVFANPVRLVPRESRVEKRVSQRRTRPRTFANGTEPAAASKLGHGKNVAYSSNWAGAVLVGSGYTSVSGVITVPAPKTPAGGSSRTEYAASAWVGLDGDTCQTAILQTGIDFYVQGSSVAYDAWYEWFPDYAYTFDGFNINTGDSIRMTATASSTSAGRVLIENLTTGRSVSHSFSGQSDRLCETNAEWIVEDFEEGGGLVPFADFDTVQFTQCKVTESSGSVIGVSGADIIDIKQNNAVLTSCNTQGSNGVLCTYN